MLTVALQFQYAVVVLLDETGGPDLRLIGIQELLTEFPYCL
jgi:hypothetical protein